MLALLFWLIMIIVATIQLAISVDLLINIQLDKKIKKAHYKALNKVLEIKEDK